MEIIRVPAPPKEAFHKGRPISDLIRHQVNHFKHLEEKLSAQERESIPKHRITTENEAAIYIRAMTRQLCSSVSATASQQTAVPVKDTKPAGAVPAASGTRATKSSGKAKSEPDSKKKK